MQNTKKQDLLSLFTHHRVAANLLMVLIILLGLWALQKLNTQFFPNFALDMVNVRTIWSGASAEDVERALTKPLEQELFGLDNLHRISSTSATGVSAITMQFKEGTDIGITIDEINQRVDRFQQLPRDAEEPEITRIVNYENIARVALSQNTNLEDLRELSYKIRDELLARGIAKIDINGLPEKEIAIEISQKQLLALNKPLSDIADSIKNASQDIPAGFVGEGDVARQLRSLSQRRDKMEFQSLEISTTAGDQKITLGDIADIEKRSRENQLLITKDGKPTVILALQRTPDSDSLKSAEILSDWLEENANQLPKGVEIQVYDQAWQLIEDRIMILLVNGLGGLLLVIAILFIFLNGRTAFWVSAGIPVSFLATLIIMYLAGSSINMISLFGLIMAVGIIVDDAIVVAEHAMSKFDQGESAEDAAENGARRMLAPVVSSSLTTIAAFLPLMIVGGVMGKIMFEIPLVIVCVVLASLFECFLILPAHMRFAFLHGKNKAPSKIRQTLDNAFDRFRDNFFTSLIELALRNRVITLSLALGMFILSIGLVAGDRIGFSFMPKTESKIINANVSFTAGTPADRVYDFLRNIEAALYQTDREFGGKNIEIAVIRQGFSSSGGGAGARRGEQYGSLFVEVSSPDKREFRNAEFIKSWQSKIQEVPGIELFTITSRHGGPPGQDLDIRLTGNTPAILKQASVALQNKLYEFSGVSAVEDDLPWGQEQLIFHLKPVAFGLGLSVDNVARQLRTAFDGQLVQRFQQRNDEIEVRVILPESEREKITSLYQYNIFLPNGNFVPLESVAEIHSQKGFDALRHSQTHLTVRISADVDEQQNNANRVLNDLKESYLPQLASQYGVRYFFEGRAANQRETMADMQLGSKVSVALIFIILAWVFKSYIKPIVVMMAIPFGITGAIFGHYVMGIELTILSLFGIVGLSGIVVNDSIILVTVYQELREKGIAVNQAIAQAATLRLRAVILTSFTTIAGLTPLLFETSVQAQFLIPMAVSITFGLGFATLLVLLVIPVLLSYQESVYHFFFAEKVNKNLQVDTQKP